MGIISEATEEVIANDMQKLLKDFSKESDFIKNNSVISFDYISCIKRICQELSLLRAQNEKMACGHLKKDLTQEKHASAEPYCTICYLHEELEKAESNLSQYRRAVEFALEVEYDEEKHNATWVLKEILKLKKSK
jgi:hypothetical protein